MPTHEVSHLELWESFSGLSSRDLHSQCQSPVWLSSVILPPPRVREQKDVIFQMSFQILEFSFQKRLRARFFHEPEEWDAYLWGWQQRKQLCFVVFLSKLAALRVPFLLPLQLLAISEEKDFGEEKERSQRWIPGCWHFRNGCVSYPCPQFSFPLLSLEVSLFCLCLNWAWQGVLSFLLISKIYASISFWTRWKINLPNSGFAYFQIVIQVFNCCKSLGSFLNNRIRDHPLYVCECVCSSYIILLFN